MSYAVNDIKKAAEYAESLTITVGLDPQDGKTLVFEHTPAPPEDIPTEMLAVIDICVEYHQRCVFNQEYQTNDVNPPFSGANDPIVDINFYLEHYKYKLLEEVKKGLASDEDESESDRKISEFSKVMLKMRERTQKKK